MKKFQFRLEKILEYKKRIEEEKKKQLAQYVSQYNLEQEKINRAKELRNEILEKIPIYLSHSSLLYQTRNALLGIKQTEINCRKNMEEIQKKIDEARLIYLKARQEREALEKLREKALEEYRYQLKKQEQKELSEASLRLWQEGKLREYEIT